jgi:dihydrofolate synthase / folylpolyglutamate synthase
LDHQEYLGTTVEEIAAEKAAIIRPGARAIIAADLVPEAADVIEARCRATGVDPVYATNDFEVEGSCGDGRLQVTFRTQQAEYPDVCLALRGRHQIANAAIAIAIAETLEHTGFTISPSAISTGLARAKHPGRLELDENQSPRVLFDGAHNAAGARALRKYFDEFVSEPITMVFGAMREKQLEKICAELFPVATNIVLTRPDNARAAGIDELIRAVPVPATSSTITVAPSARDAVVIARSLTKSGGLICVTGSLYLVGEVKRILNSLASQHVP